MEESVEGGPPVCPICSGRSAFASRKLHAPISRELTFTLYSCSDCGVGFLDPQPDDEFLRAEVYNTEYALYDFGWTRRQRVSIARRMYRTAFPHPLLKLLPSTPGAALDVGCGSGYWLNQLKERGWRATGMDIDSATIAHLRSLGFEGIIGSIETTDIGKDRYDLVLLSAVLEHLHDPELVLRKVHDALRPGGSAVIDVPNFGSLEIGLFGDAWLMFSIGHLFYFTEGSLTYLLGKVGLVPEGFVARSAELTTGYSLARRLGIRRPGAALAGAPLQLLLNSLDTAGEVFVRARKVA